MDFYKQANEDYADFVRQAWEKFETMPAIPKPKDDSVPPVVLPDEDENKPIKDNEITFNDIIPVIEQKPQPEPPQPIKDNPQPTENYYSFSFFGTQEKVRLDENMRFKLKGADNKSIANCWQRLAESDYDNLISDCLALRSRHKLCDWAYLLVLRDLADSFFGKNTNESTLLSSYLYCRSGYMMRLAEADNKLYMLYASKHAIYGNTYFKIDGIKFYTLDFSGNNIYVCPASYPGEQPMSLLIPDNMQFTWNATENRTLKSKRYSDMNVDVCCNKNSLDFYNTYPTSEINDDFMTRWAMYANTPMEDGIKDSLYPALRKKIDGLSKKEATERLLNWVQTAFEYEYDEKIWGYDRAFFPEETLYYPYCDCEDRSILFTRLVRDLLGLPCILIYYPGHLASAVCFDKDVKGDYISLNGKKFVVCDPTYIGASIGLTMPDMDNSSANVILLQ
ncbi:MAG: transglutaminase-like domain-containing protein [Prevotella sp.]|nr:transglutaminase-like domain-containing protein [Prevotella sp.]